MSNFETVTLLGVKQRQKPFEAFFKRMFFGTELFSETEKVAIDELVPNLRLVPFVSPIVAGTVRRQDGSRTTSYQPPYMKPLDLVSPKQMMKRLPGEALNGKMSPAARLNATVAQLLKDQEEAMVRTEEKMCVDAVLTGKFVIEGSEEHEAMEVDYGRNAANNITLIGPERWSQLDKETTDMAQIIEELADLSSGIPDLIIYDKKAYSEFASFKSVKAGLDTKVANGNSELMLAPEIKKVVQYKGRFGQYDIWVYNGEYEKDGGERQRLMPEYGMVMGPSVYDGVMAYGAIQDVEAGDDGVARAKRWPKVWVNKNPSARYLMTQSAPLPIMPDANEFVVVTVDGPV